MKKRIFYRIVLFSAAALVLLAVTVAGLVYAFQDKIIQLFVAEANRHLKTKVEVGKIELSLWDKFPQVAISLEQVKISGSLPDETTPLATGRRLYFTFGLNDIISGKYRVREFSLEHGQVSVKVQPDGQVNYLVFEADSSKKETSGDFSFDLEKISLKDVLVDYDNRQLNQTYQADAKDLAAALDISTEKVKIKAEGSAFIHAIRIGENAYFKGKDIYLKTGLDVLRAEEKVVFEPSEIKVGPAAYNLNGWVDYKNATELDLKLDGKNTNIQSLLSLLPGKYTKPLRQYRSKGNVYFNGRIKGTSSGNSNPLITFGFGCRNASFYHPQYKEKLENISLEGSFTNGAKHNQLTSAIELKNLRGTLRGRPFSGDLTYKNFRDPHLTVNAKADLDIAHVLALFPQEEITEGSGLAQVKVAFSGNLKQFGNRPANQGLKASGDLQLQHANLKLKAYGQPFTDLNGSFLLRRSDVAVSDFTGKLGSSDFKLDGYFKNMLGWLVLPDQPLLVEADFDAAYLNLDELLAGAAAEPSAAKEPSKTSGDYKLVISPDLNFDLNARIKKLRFRRFHSRNVKGTVRLKDQVVSSPDISLQVAGGRFSVQGSLNAQSRNHLKVSTNAWIEDIRVDSLFYAFENFGQTFLQQRHLKGELTANIKSDLYFDSNLNALTDKMEADINATLVNGQLVYFEPLQKLSAVANRHELANLQFAELTNHFWIQDRTIYIPEMEIRSNVSRASVIGISGTHTFDQQMDYKFRIPLTAAAGKRDKDERFGKVEVVQAGGPATLFLTLKGNESNYKIAYDKDRVKTKLKDDLKKEKQELTDALRGKKEPEKAAEIKDDEYFDF